MNERREEKSWLSASSEQDLARVLGVARLKDLEQRQFTRLPEAVFRHTWTAVDASEKQRREVFYGFALQQGAVTKVAEKTGTPPSFTVHGDTATIMMEVPPQRSLLNALLHGLDDTEYLVHFHTHPRLQAADIMQSKHAAEFCNARGMHAQKIVTGFNNQLCSFSESDLWVMKNHDPHHRSMLLGTHLGYRWIIDPHQGKRTADLAKNSLKIYESQHDQITKNYFSYGSRGTFPSSSWYTHQIDQITRNFCEENGYLLFGNNDPYSSMLHNMTKETPFPLTVPRR